MPASRPRASFEPIAPDFDLRELVETTENFQYVDRISCDTIEEQGLEQFEKLILLHVVIGGKPLVVDGFEEKLDPWTFTPKWLKDNHGDKVENARNITTKENIPLTIGHYLSNLGKLTDQYFDAPENYKDKNRQRVYLKDIDCPPVWQEKLKEHIPASLFYWNDNTGEVGGPGAVDEAIPNGTGRRKGREIANAGDLMSSLPQEMRAENLMCYIGHEGTYTPAHREMCASLGHNIMVNASEAFDENGQPEKPGSSIWFMTEAKDRHIVQEYWLSVLGHDIETENHFAQVVAWQRAPFKVYVVEQKAGDFILIPPLAPHQVWNRGTRTMKVAWNRTTVETLEKAMVEALPNARMVCRDEQYKNKAIIYYTLLKYSALLKQARIQASRSQHEAQRISQSRKVRQVQRDFKRLFELFKNILISESFASGTKETTELLPFDSNITCAYCRGNIFNRFLSCKTCMDMLNTGVDEPYDLCMHCFVMGRSCGCQSKYKWMEQWRWKDLVARYDEWRKQIIDIDGGMTGKTPLSLEEERQLYPKRTLAQVCQEQLKMRPWVDIKAAKPEKEEGSQDEQEEIEVDDNGLVKRIKKKRSKAWLENNKSCHVCCHRHPKWKMAICTMCERGWCYGSLWRAHDQAPQDVMQDPNWECPHCRRVCSTGACRKDTRQHPYEPKGTLLGHDTKIVADVRSVEALVDFSVSNLNWIKETADQPAGGSARLQRKKEEADRAKLHDDTLNEFDEDEDEGIVADRDARGEIEYSPQTTNLIDPALGGNSGAVWPASQNSFAGTPTMNGNADPGANNFDADTSTYPDPSDLNSGFVAPSALMYRNEVVEDADPQPSTSSSKKKKRARPDDIEQIKLVTSKKQKLNHNDKSLPKNKASKQYQVQQETKRLEEARKAGRYIQVMAAIKKRSCKVVLKIDPLRLEAKLAELDPFANHSPSHPPVPSVLLTSDIAPPKPSGFQAINNPQQPKKQKAFKVRVEDDGDFHSWDRSNKGNRSLKKGPGSKPKYEEITVESDEEDFMDDEAPSNLRKEGRSSQWLARKHQDGDEDLPDALPDNFKDGDVNPRAREKERERRERRETMPARPQKAPAIRPSMRASTGGSGLDDSNSTVGYRGRGRPPKAIAQAKAMQMAKAAMLEAENKKAKLAALGLVEDDDEEKASESSDEEMEKSAPSGPARESIFAKRKNIKIVGAPQPKDKVQVEISDDESSSSGSSSAEEIPAAPVRRGPPGRTTLPGITDEEMLPQHR
ncbi:hypothetical protein EG328_009887 [Venturia inaequalis]|uniref:JmjC domain-containing protein n=1 Tax=Venturia inaequalis TaxID=5025 RepID=A0A8H3VLE2_VENIN|nr:hypothetical protein EG328_009887 [Venturia inaequalis]KAE9990541.1 hypothetical protein EG327_001267 [Venturia inaequalis]